MTDRELLKEARDLIVMCSLLDKSNQCNKMADKIDKQLAIPLVSKSLSTKHPKCLGDEIDDCGYNTKIACDDCKYNNSPFGKKDPNAICNQA